MWNCLIVATWESTLLFYYLFSFSVVLFVCLTIELSFLIESLLIVFSFLYNLVSHLLLSFLLFLKMNGIFTASTEAIKIVLSEN